MRKNRTQAELEKMKVEAWRADPVLFCKEVIGIDPDPLQAEAMRHLVDPHGCVSVRAARGAGKTFGIESPMTAWFMVCFAPCRVITTAPTWYQVEQLHWRDLSAHVAKARIKFDPGLLKTKWEWPLDRFATGISPEKPERVEGPHSENVLIVIDEAKAVSRDVRRRLRGSFSTCKRANELACSTPWDKKSAFFDDCTSADWKHVHIPAHKSPWIKPEWIEKCKREWSEESPLYRSQVMAEFVEVSETALVALDWIENARVASEERDDDAGVIIGVDVARFGTDNSAIYTRRGRVVTGAETIHGENTMEVSNRVAARARDGHADLTLVDSTGIGSGVADRLREMRIPCEDFDAGSSAYDEAKFKNARAEAYWNVRERLKDGKLDLSQIPEARYRALLEELTTLEFSYAEGGKIAIEPKEQWRKRTAAQSEEKVAHSPDDADALAICCYGDVDRSAGFDLAALAGVEGEKRNDE